MTLRWALVLGAVALLLVGATLATVFAVWASSPERVAEELSRRLETHVEIKGDVEFSFFGRPRVEVTQLQVEKPGGTGSQEFIALDTLAISLRWWKLWDALFVSRPYLLDVTMTGGDLWVTEADFSGDDAAWPSDDDPFSALFNWVHSINLEKISLRFKTRKGPWRSLEVKRLEAVIATAEGDRLQIDLSPLVAVFEGVPINADLHIEAPPVDAKSGVAAELSGSVRVRKLDIDPFLADMEGEADGTQRPVDIPTNLCKAWVGELDLSVAELKVSGREVQNVQLKASSARGVIDVNLVDVQFPGGHSEGRLSLHCGSLPGALSLEIHLGSEGLPEASHEGKKGVLAFNRVEASLKLAGEGRNWRELVSGLKGRFSVFLGPFETDELLVGLYGKNLFHALTVSWKEPEKSVIDCAVLDMAVNQGVAESQQILIGTPTLVIDGHGRVDLLQDEIDFLLVPHSKTFGFGRLEEPISIKGPILSPKIGMDWKRLSLKLGIGTALGILNPILGALPLTDLATDEKAACQKALRESKDPTAASKKPSKAKKSRGHQKKGAR